MRKDQQRKHGKKDETAGIGGLPRKSECPVVVIGIGAAAGGLKSLKQLFTAMPSGNRVAFVVIPHPDAPSESLTIKELRELTSLPVVEATDGMPILADRIHVMPPQKFLNINRSRLTLHEPLQCDGLWMPIDHFFCSLAADQRRHGCGIILSGAGSDGTLGLSEIKAAGGRTIVEDPGSAEFPQMPQSAIEAGLVDAVLPAESIADAILSFAKRVIADTRNEPTESPEFDSDLRAILDILRAKAGHDFRCYKLNTLVRRIRRRMTLGKASTFADYARFLQENPDEVGLLRKDLLIGVTEFFRQPQAWEVLEQKVIAPLVEKAAAGSEIRIWVPGCSTGQEVYSLAMLLAEHVEKSGKKLNIQTFATDSDAAALAAARSGRYSKEEIGKNLSPARLKRYFERKDGFYQVVKAIRSQVVFAPQNITADPPFSRLDLISCRNLLIYLDQEAQKKIIALCHFALREGGFLFLGTAESVGDRDDLFAPVSKKWRVYRRIGIGRPVGVEIPVRPAGEPLPMQENLNLPALPSRVSLASMAQQVLLDRFAPACVMIDRKLQVVYVHGAVEEYLTFPPGELTTRVVDMARDGLRARLRGAIGKCLETNRPLSVTARVRRGQKSIPVKATVNPLRYPREADGLLLITFEDYRAAASKSRRGAAGESGVQQLEDELKVTREELQSTIEQLEASNDQLKASNEEVTAANEELQSANEEMETSKEELQSLNEELNTINARLHEKVEELENINNDIVNLLSSTNIATVFLDKELNVRSYTPASTRLFSLIPSDAGRPIADVLRRFTDETMLDNARRVLADLTPLSKEVQAEDGGWYIRRITPYRTKDDRIEGVVVTFVDVCDLKATEDALRRHQADLETARAEAENARRRLAVIVDSIADGFFAFDREWRITHVNDSALRHYRKTREEMVGRDLFEVFPAARGTVFEAEYRRAMGGGEPVHFEAPSVISDRIIEIHAYPGPDNMTVLFRDVTERNRMAAALQEAHKRAEWLGRFPEENPNPVMRVSADGTILYCNPATAKMPGWECKVGQGLQQPLLSLVERVMGEGTEAEEGLELGGRFYSVWASPFRGERYTNIYGRDITARKKSEEALKEATRLIEQNAAELEAILETMADPLLFYDDQGRPRKINTAAARALGIDRDVSGLDEPALMAVWKSKNYRDMDGRPLSLEEMPFRRALNGETVHGQVLCLTTAEGEEVVFEASAVALESNGRRLGVVVFWHDITERKRAEQALRNSEARSKLLSETAGRLLVTDDPQGIVNELCRDVMAHLDCHTFFNFLAEPFVERLHLNAWAGIPEEEARKIEWLDYGVAVCGCAARDGCRIVAEHIPTTPDVRTELVKSYGIKAYACHPLLGLGGKVMGTLSFGTRSREVFSQEDLSLMKAVTDQVAVAMERMRLIRELQKSRGELEQRVAEQTAEIRRGYDAVKAERQRLYDVLETLPAYVVLLSEDYHVPFANRFFIERFGESHGKRCFEYLFGRSAACEICESYKVLKTKAPHHWEWSGPDGRLYDIHDYPFTDTDGSFLILEMGIDITERKRAEDSLKEANEKLRAEMAARVRLAAAAEQAGEGLVITNPEGVIDYANPAFERISGAGRQGTRGKSYYDILADEDLKKKVQRSAAQEETWSGRVTRKSDSQSLEVDVTFSPIRDPSGAVTSYLAVERDVTQEVRLEQHLRQMQKMEALGTLAGGIAHDFNNILNPIFINTELVLLDAPEASPMRPPLQLVLEAAERGKGLVKQIITFSRQKEHEAKPLKAEPLVKEALKFLRASLPSTVEIREKIERETKFILADPTQVYQVVMNLCSNAAYAMREQGGVLEVGLAEVEVDADMARLHPDMNPGPYLRLTVSDTGVGMTKEVLERAFDPFFTTKKPGEGSGMGLSVVHGIVTNAKGAITAYSEVGKGSTFNVFFPGMEAEESSVKVSPEPVATGRERVLLVDDEEVQVQSIRNMLERLGYTVVAMTDSAEALSLFRKDPSAFDLVITDQTMPQLTGVRLAEEILRIRPGLPVVLCTGFSEMVDADGAQAAGICQFLMKPFSLRDMGETIRRALGGK